MRGKTGTRFLVILVAAAMVFLGAGWALAQPTVVKIGYMQNDDEQMDVIAKRAAAFVEEKLPGKYKFEFYCCGKLGSEEAMFLSTKTGALHWVFLSAPGYADPMMNITAAPYVYRGKEQFYKIYEGPVGQEIYDRFEKVTGVRPIESYYRLHQMVFTTKPLTKPDDWKHFKIRTATSPAWTAQVKAVGGNVVPLPFPEVYMALKTGVVDGVQTVIDWFVGFKLYEVCKFAIDIKHDFSPVGLFVNKKYFEGLPADHQKVFMQAFKGQKAENEKWVDEKHGWYLNRLKEEGVKLTIAPEADIELYRKMCDKYIRDNAALFGGVDIYEKMIAVK